MPSKLDSAGRMAQRLAEVPEPPKPEPKAAKPRPPRGVPITLRLPEELLAGYALEAGRRSGEIGRTVTAQTVMLEILAAGLPRRG